MSRLRKRVPHWDDCHPWDHRRSPWDDCPSWDDHRRPHHDDRKPPCEERLFSLVDSVPANGAAGVRSGRFTLTLTFDENVVDNGVWAHNRNRIKMWAGTFRIPIRVSHSTASGQRRKVFITPINGLPANSKITIAVAADFRSSSGHCLGKTAIIIFSTVKFASVVRRPRRRRLFPTTEE
ncbi:MAG: Ig-like domain-containing protein [Syntrophomonadaceae bacterium]|jgi:hypothetical protein